MVVRTVVPVSVRGQDEAGAITNRVSAVLANLPVSEPDPLRRTFGGPSALEIRAEHSDPGIVAYWSPAGAGQ